MAAIQGPFPEPPHKIRSEPNPASGNESVDGGNLGEPLNSAPTQPPTSESIKDPDGDAKEPASMPESLQGQFTTQHKEDLAGNQGGQRGGGPDVVQHR